MRDSQTEKGYFTTHEAARKLLVNSATIIQWVKKGHIKVHKTLGGHRRIPAEEVNRIWNEMSKDFREDKNKNL